MRSFFSSSIDRIGRFLHHRRFSSLPFHSHISFPHYSNYAETYHRSIEDPANFWLEAASMISWFSPPSLENTAPNASAQGRWYRDGVMNTCFNALDYHVIDGRGDQTAIIYDSPLAGKKSTISYKKLLTLTSEIAGALIAHGVKKGDTVLLYLPMVPHTIAIMLACARIGAIHSVVFGGFAGHELAKRIKDAKPKVIFTASCGLEPNKVIPYMPMVEEAINEAKFNPEKIILLQREQHKSELKEGRDIDFYHFVTKYGKTVPCEPLNATDPLYILYTSGTTGLPKGVVRDNGGHAVALKWAMHYIMNMKAGQRFWAASDMGWVVGHSFINYGPLLSGLTTVVYEGKPVHTPDAGAFWRVASEYKINGMFTAPTALRAIKKEDPELSLVREYDLSSLKHIFLAGERADPETIIWATKGLAKPVYDNWWQTETGWPMVSNQPGLETFPVKAGSSTKPVPGYDIHVLDDNGNRIVEKNKSGNLVVKTPLPPGTLQTLWNNEARFQKGYFTRFPGYYDTADAGFIDDDGYVHVMSRTDDVMNVAGHRLGSSQMEEVISEHVAVSECAVIGVADTLKGQIPVGLVVLKSGITINENQLEKEISLAVRSRVGPIANLKRVIIVSRLPKTRSGKILRNVMRAIADGEEIKIPPTIEDVNAVKEIQTIFKEKDVQHKH